MDFYLHRFHHRLIWLRFKNACGVQNEWIYLTPLASARCNGSGRTGGSPVLLERGGQFNSTATRAEKRQRTAGTTNTMKASRKVWRMNDRETPFFKGQLVRRRAGTDDRHESNPKKKVPQTTKDDNAGAKKIHKTFLVNVFHLRSGIIERTRQLGTYRWWQTGRPSAVAAVVVAVAAAELSSLRKDQCRR